jgi:ABC-type transport system involved in multi-copper enzyme maturation permease subunit
MRAQWTIAKNTFREIIRDRILYGIIVFALLLIGLSLVLGQLSFSEQARISADFGFAGIQLGSAVLAIFIGSSLVAKEIEKQTILTLLARPITRTQFVLGKFMGLNLVLLTILLGLSSVLALILFGLGFPISGVFFVAILGIALEAMLLVALALFFGSFARPVMTVIFASAIFLLGHWVGSLSYFIEKSDSAVFRSFARFITWVIPDLERFNWRAAPIYSISVPVSDIILAIGYSLGWTMVLMALTSIIFRRRDFV